MAEKPEPSDQKWTVTITITENADPNSPKASAKTWVFDRVDSMDEAVDYGDDGAAVAKFTLHNAPKPS